MWPENSLPYRVSQDTSKFKYTCWFGDRLYDGDGREEDRHAQSHQIDLMGCRVMSGFDLNLDRLSRWAVAVTFWAAVRFCEEEEERSVVRITRIVKESFELGLSNVRWFVMGNDNTVLFTENLVTVLSKYDHNQMYYISGNFESVEANVMCSYNIAYGGSGTAISYPLELVKILDDCINRYHYVFGSNLMISNCMSEIGVPLTKELGFHQKMDIQGSPQGLLTAHPVAPLVSLHHLDLYMVQSLIPSMTQFDFVKKLIESYKNDPSRIMQHTLCYDLNRNWSLSVSWGYSVQLYPWLMNARELGLPMQTFKTWIGSKELFIFDTWTNYVDPCKRPIEFYLDQVIRLQNGETFTNYSTFIGHDSIKQCENQKYKSALAIRMVNVTAPILSPLVWRQILQKLLALHVVNVVIITKPINAKRYKSIVTHAIKSNLKVKLIPLHFPSQEVGLPQGCENLDTLKSLELFKEFFLASEMMQKPLEKLIQDLEPKPISLCNKDIDEMVDIGNKASIDEHICLKWLDSMKPKPVIYACFGSLCQISFLQMKEIGLGLESSNVPFIWIIRGLNFTLEVKKWLRDENFEEKVKGRGMIIRGWAPQVLILTHPSIGGFLTHCEWDSTLEGISCGVSMITFPTFAEQFYNEKFIVNILKIGVQVGVEVSINFWNEEKNGVLVNKDQVKNAINQLMDKGFESEERRKIAKDLAHISKKAIQEEGSSYLNIKLLIEDVMEQLKNKEREANNVARTM
ncbi:hypothetical protein H5410_044656 [Solanum commersonii]|uniref:Uncharacterized protein n=1 Tax=Solanum commersonii TaxID=4109 RepID=A0A9J5XAC4_SOLCO|nr:hypothetical protein H5410_044656 [Solanum commersonii]